MLHMLLAEQHKTQHKHNYTLHITQPIAINDANNRNATPTRMTPTTPTNHGVNLHIKIIVDKKRLYEWRGSMLVGACTRGNLWAKSCKKKRYCV